MANAQLDMQVFLDMGLDKGEAEIYLALLELGPSLASAVAKKTRIDRSVVYKKLHELIEKGFVAYHVRENRRYFQAADPNELLDLVEERERRIRELMPALLSMKKPQEEETKVEVFRGREGFKAVMNDMLRQAAKGDKTIYALGYSGSAPGLTGVWYDGWTKRRVDAKIKRVYLVESKKLGWYGTKQPLTEIRVLPKDLQFPSSLCMYGKKSAILFPQEKEFTGVVIESEGITKSNRAYFEAIWRKSKRVQ